MHAAAEIEEGLKCPHASFGRISQTDSMAIVAIQKHMVSLASLIQRMNALLESPS
jgi:hypothetical protein